MSKCKKKLFAINRYSIERNKEITHLTENKLMQKRILPIIAQNQQKQNNHSTDIETLTPRL